MTDDAPPMDEAAQSLLAVFVPPETPETSTEADLHDRQKRDAQTEDNSKLTVAGCLLALLTVAVIFGVAIPLVRWLDPQTGQPLPRMVAIFTPFLIGAAVNGIATLLLRFVGLRVFVKQEESSER